MFKYFYPDLQLRFKNKVKAKKDKRERRRMQIEKAKTQKVIDKGKKYLFWSSEYSVRRPKLHYILYLLDNPWCFSEDALLTPQQKIDKYHLDHRCYGDAWFLDPTGWEKRYHKMHSKKTIKNRIQKRRSVPEKFSTTSKTEGKLRIKLRW